MSEAVSRVPERRLAAWVALLAGATATLLLLTTIVTSPIATLLSIVGFAAAVASGWAAVTSRGPRRTRSILIGAAGVVLVILTVVKDEEHRFYVFFAVLAIVVAVAAGRFALGHPPRRPATDVPVAAARAPALVVNPRSGDGRAAQLGLVARARDLGIRVYEFDATVPVVDLVRAAIADGADAVGMAGGDGSLAPAAALAAESGVDFVCIPAGTRNHFALDLGLDRDDPLAALEAFGPAHRRSIDLAEVNGLPFVNNVSLGLYGEIVQDANYRGAKLGTTLARLPDLVTDSPAGLDLVYVDPSGVERSDAQVIHVSNNPYLFSGATVGRPRIDGGELGVLCLRVDGLRVAEVLARSFLGGSSDTWQSWTAADFEVWSTSPVPAGLDGEAVTLNPPVRFRIRPQAVNVRLPNSAPGESPLAQRPGYRFAVRELVSRAFLPAPRWRTPPPTWTEGRR